MELDGVMLSKPKVRVIKTNERSAVFDITIHEGRNRQVRRMCENVGMNVKRLTRISEGGIKLGNLQKGTWRYLTDDEIRRLRGVES
jgi:23S rRNA pseudouridine2605 synthase